jgi:Mn-containing catalase
MFEAALDTIQPNFPPGVMQGDPRYTHTYTDILHQYKCSPCG